jgi:DNA-binding CsgD family transcriptional regulator
MKQIQNMINKISSSPYYNQMVRFTAPLKDHFGVNHFWYYKISTDGHYSFVGTHSAWNEFCIDNSLLKHFPCLRHPTTQHGGIHIMKACQKSNFKKVLNVAWEKFNINFNINLVTTIPEGIEAFGFATCFNDPYADERLINELPLLRQFTKKFKENHERLFLLLEDNQVDLSAQFGSTFYESSQAPFILHDRDLFLKKMGMDSFLSLTNREMDVLKFLASGYPASFIASKLFLNKRTIETHIDTIKGKLYCNSKVELIQRAQEIFSYR